MFIYNSLKESLVSGLCKTQLTKYVFCHKSIRGYNKTLWNVLVQENNQLQDGNSYSTLHHSTLDLTTPSNCIMAATRGRIFCPSYSEAVCGAGERSSPHHYYQTISLSECLSNISFCHGDWCNSGERIWCERYECLPRSIFAFLMINHDRRVREAGGTNKHKWDVFQFQELFASTACSLNGRVMLTLTS